MRIEQLRYFYTVAQTGSISAAAQELFISQQGVSDSLHRMEQELGVTLLVRNYQGCSVTPQGAQLLPYVKTILENYDALTQLVADFSKKSMQRLHILVTPFLSNTMIPDLIDHLFNMTPPVMLSYNELSLSGMLSYLANEKCEAAIFSLLAEDIAKFSEELPAGYRLYKLFDDELYVSCSTTHPLASCNHVTNAQIARYPMVNFNSVYWNGSQQDLSDLGNTANSASLQYKMLSHYEVLATSSKFFARTLFKQRDVIAIPYDPPRPFTHLILLPEAPSSTTAQLLEALSNLCQQISGQLPDYQNDI